MNPLWIQLLVQIASGTLKAQGKREYGQWISEAWIAQQAGKNIDAELKRMADLWAENGEPAFDDIAASRKSIQAAVGD